MSDWPAAPYIAPNTIHLADALELCKALPDESVDAIVTDPPYAEIDRDYGRMTEDEWFTLMLPLTAEFKRVLKPSGSAVVIIHPNMSQVGSMRLWAFKYLVQAAESWNLVQDAYWWNYTQPPLVTSQKEVGLMRGSVKLCVWLGAPDCYRNQDNVLWSSAEETKTRLIAARAERVTRPSGVSMNAKRALQTANDRGGSTPFNLIPIPNSDSANSAGAFGHGAGTPQKLADWWVRYICPPGGIVLDPFGGSGTMGIAALRHGCRYILGEKMPEYVELARKRLNPEFGNAPKRDKPVEAVEDLPLFARGVA